VGVVPTAMTLWPPSWAALTRSADAVPLRVRRLADVLRAHAGVQRDRRDPDSIGDEPCHELGCEPACRARHLGAAGIDRERGLVRLDRPTQLGAAVADRVAVAGEIVEQGGGESRHGNPESGRTVLREPAHELERAPAVEPDAVAGPRSPVGQAAGPAGSPKLNHPPGAVAVGQRGREVGHAPVVGADRRGHRRRRVDDEQVTGFDEVGQLAERGVDEFAGVLVRDEHPDLVAREPAFLGRGVRDPVIGQLERWRGQHAHDAAPAVTSTGASARAS
jgi:hypothetical protein